MYLQSTCNITYVDFKNLWLNVADRRIAPLITPENGPFFSEVVIIVFSAVLQQPLLSLLGRWCLWSHAWHPFCARHLDT